jgi:hypothetical protein
MRQENDSREVDAPPPGALNPRPERVVQNKRKGRTSAHVGGTDQSTGNHAASDLVGKCDPKRSSLALPAARARSMADEGAKAGARLYHNAPRSSAILFRVGHRRSERNAPRAPIWRYKRPAPLGRRSVDIRAKARKVAGHDESAIISLHNRARCIANPLSLSETQTRTY